MTIDHDAIAAQLRLMSDACACDTDYCEHVEAHDDAPDYDGMSAAYLALYDEVKRLRAERLEMFGNHAHVVRGIIGAAGKLPAMDDGPLKDGFISGMEEVAARADLDAGDGNHQMQDLCDQIIDLFEGRACIVMLSGPELSAKLARAEKAEAERDALRAHPYLPAEEIAAVESGNRRWHGEYDTTVSVRWEPYKPDGQRQMKAKGRWQTMTYNGSGYFRWENCNRPAQVRQALKGQTND